jgi:hypothetical protein
MVGHGKRNIARALQSKHVEGLLQDADAENQEPIEVSLGQAETPFDLENLKETVIV